MRAFRNHRPREEDEVRRTDGSPTPVALGSWPNRRACYPDVWPTVGDFDEKQTITNGSSSKLVTVGRIDSCVRRCCTAVQPVLTARALILGGLLLQDRVQHPTPREHARRLVHAMNALSIDGCVVARYPADVLQEPRSTTTSRALLFHWLAGFTGIRRDSHGPGAHGGGRGTIVVAVRVRAHARAHMLVGGSLRRSLLVSA